MSALDLSGIASRAQQGPGIQEFLGRQIQLLQGISNQLDLLIQLECGHLKRADMKQRIADFEEANRGNVPVPEPI